MLLKSTVGDILSLFYVLGFVCSVFCLSLCRIMKNKSLIYKQMYRMKKRVFALLRTFVFVALLPALSINLVSCAQGDKDVVENTDGEDDDPVTPPSTAPEGVEAVDLGLSVLWASCNVGAESPEEYGGYYAWGEIEEKAEYDWSTYKWCDGDYDALTKYCTNSRYGTADNRSVLIPEDDVAHVEWGGNWRMPTLSEFEELAEECTWVWTTVDGVNGSKVTGPNGNSIFLPAAGFCYGKKVHDQGDEGYYWCATSDSEYSPAAYYLGTASAGYVTFEYFRYNGHSVRPVTNKLPGDGNNEGDKEDDKDDDDNDDDNDDEAGGEGGGQGGGEGGNGNGGGTSAAPEAVDLGLSVKWATFNVGAKVPEEYGGYYAWGETEEKSNYDWPTYKWCEGNDESMTKYCTDEEFGIVDGKTTLDLEDDVVHVLWGEDWRMPTSDEMEELINECYWEWVTVNDAKGYMVTGPNGNSIFLPAAGERAGEGVYNKTKKYGYYWTSTLNDKYSCYACYFYFYNGSCKLDKYGNRSFGYAVRPVTE